MLLRNRFKTHPDQEGIAAEDVDLRRLSDNALIDTQTTDIDGIVEFELDGNPGPCKMVMTHNGETREVYGNMSEQHGPMASGEFSKLLNLFSAGVLEGLSVSASSGMDLSVAAGIAYGSSNLHSSYAPATVTIGANGSGNPRIDIVGIEIADGDYTHPWQTQVVVVAGTPAASPVAPTYSGTDRILIPLAYVTVGAGVSSITGGNITDQRQFSAPTISDNSITLGKLAASGALSGQTIQFNGSDWVPVSTGTTTQSFMIPFQVSGGTSAVPLGVPDEGLYFGYGFTITGWVASCLETGTIKAALQYCTYANYPTYTTISGTAPMTISAARKAKNLAVSGWSPTTIAADSFLNVNITENSGAVKNATFFVVIERTI